MNSNDYMSESLDGQGYYIPLPFLTLTNNTKTPILHPTYSFLIKMTNSEKINILHKLYVKHKFHSKDGFIFRPIIEHLFDNKTIDLIQKNKLLSLNKECAVIPGNSNSRILIINMLYKYLDTNNLL